MTQVSRMPPPLFPKKKFQKGEVMYCLRTAVSHIFWVPQTVWVWNSPYISIKKRILLHKSWKHRVFFKKTCLKNIGEFLSKKCVVISQGGIFQKKEEGKGLCVCVSVYLSPWPNGEQFGTFLSSPTWLNLGGELLWQLLLLPYSWKWGHLGKRRGEETCEF